VDATPPSFRLAVGMDAVSATPSFPGSLLQDPAQPLFHKQPFDRALEDMVLFRTLFLMLPVPLPV